MGNIQGDPHVLSRTSSDARKELKAHQDVVYQVGRPADCKQDHHCHQHLDHLGRHLLD